MAERKMLFLGLLIIASQVNVINCYSKRWIWSTNWNDARNWDKGRVPCSNDDITLGEGAIYVNKNATVNNLVFQSNGEIIFGENSEVVIEETPTPSSTNNSSCKGEPIRFIGSTPRDWFNPLNWNFIENGAVADWNDATLYMDRIPCKHDTVTFPEANAFSVSVGQDAEVAELYFGKQALSNAELSTYLASIEGKLRFKNSVNRTISVNDKKCLQRTGCSCGYSKIKDFICKKFQCPAVCKNKVKPLGDCCERCGALVTMGIKQEFNLNLCQASLRSQVSSSTAKLVISPIEVNSAIEKVQILLTDKVDGADAIKAAKSAVEYLASADKASGCGVYNVKISTDGSGGDGGKTGRSTGKKGSNTTAIALGVSLAIVLIIVIIGALYLMRRRRSGFFNKQVLMNEMDLARSPHMEMQDTEFIKDVFDFDTTMGGSGLKGESFENPMYDEVMRKTPAVIEPTRDSPHLKRDVDEPVKESKKEEKKKKKGNTGKKTKSKVKKSESNDAFDNPVYGTANYIPDFDDSEEKPVPGETGYNNPLYSDMFTQGNPADIEEVNAAEPPSFLDTIGFGASEFDTEIDSSEFKNQSIASKKVKITLDDAPRNQDDSEA